MKNIKFILLVAAFILLNFDSVLGCVCVPTTTLFAFPTSDNSNWMGRCERFCQLLKFDTLFKVWSRAADNRHLLDKLKWRFRAFNWKDDGTKSYDFYELKVRIRINLRRGIIKKGRCSKVFTKANKQRPL